MEEKESVNAYVYLFKFIECEECDVNFIEMKMLLFNGIRENGTIIMFVRL